MVVVPGALKLPGLGCRVSWRLLLKVATVDSITGHKLWMLPKQQQQAQL